MTETLETGPQDWILDLLPGLLRWAYFWGYEDGQAGDPPGLRIKGALCR